MESIFAKISGCLLVVALTGCTTANPDIVAQHSAAARQQYAQGQATAQRGRALLQQHAGSPVDQYNERRGISPELAAQRVKYNHQAASWINTPPQTRITPTGPDLSAYGNTYGDVGMCKVDVALAVQDAQRARKYQKRCYDLLPIKLRAQLYQLDQVELTPVERVDIIIRVEPSKSIPQVQRPASQWR